MGGVIVAPNKWDCSCKGLRTAPDIQSGFNKSWLLGSFLFWLSLPVEWRKENLASSLHGVLLSPGALPQCSWGSYSVTPLSAWLPLTCPLSLTTGDFRCSDTRLLLMGAQPHLPKVSDVSLPLQGRGSPLLSGAAGHLFFPPLPTICGAWDERGQSGTPVSSLLLLHNVESIRQT